MTRRVNPLLQLMPRCGMLPGVKTRSITRYGSRKLYDSEARRYVSLDELAKLVGDGARLQVTDKQSGQDVTAQTLALVVYEQARQGAMVTTEVLHDVIRSGVGQLQVKVDAKVHAAVDRVTPLLKAREEVGRLRAGLAEVERALKGIAGEGKGRSRRSARGIGRKRKKN